jgi:hypothetical protein
MSLILYTIIHNRQRELFSVDPEDFLENFFGVLLLSRYSDDTVKFI